MFEGGGLSGKVGNVSLNASLPSGTKEETEEIPLTKDVEKVTVKCKEDEQKRENVKTAAAVGGGAGGACGKDLLFLPAEINNIYDRIFHFDAYSFT